MARDVGPWTLHKLKLLRLYLPAYLQATTSAVDRVFIDGFAGPGTNQVRETEVIVDGSPLVALDAKAPNNPSRFTDLFFIELDRGDEAELRSLIADRGADPRAHVVPGDVNDELPRIVRSFHQDAPIFVFLDPAGIEPRWSTIEAVAPWRTELLINFPLGMSINLNADSQKVSDYFGTDEWRPYWEQGDVRGLLDLYKTALRDLGYVYQHDLDRLISTGPGDRGKRLYYLIHVAKREPAKRIWDWVLKQPDALGQLRFQL